MKKSCSSLACIAVAILGIDPVPLEAKKLKKFNSLLVKKALIVRGNLKVNGTINGVQFGRLAYGSFVNITNNTMVVADGAPIPFTHDTVPSCGLTHSPTPLFTTITIDQTGAYLVWYKVRIGALSPITTQLYRNGTPIFGTDDSGFTTTIEGIIITAQAGDQITLVNISGAPITLGSAFGGSAPPVSLALLRVV